MNSPAALGFAFAVGSWCCTEYHSSLVEMAFAINTLFALLSRVWRGYSLRVRREITVRALQLHSLFGQNVTEDEFNKLETEIRKILRSFHRKYEPIVKWFKKIGLLFAFLCVLVLWSGTLKKIGYYSLILILPFPTAVAIIWGVYFRTMRKVNKLCAELEKARVVGIGELPSVDVAAEADAILRQLK